MAEKTAEQTAHEAALAAAKKEVDKIDAFTKSIVERFGDDARLAARLAQFETSMTTAAMAVEHLFDEEMRLDHDKAERIRKIEEEG